MGFAISALQSKYLTRTTQLLIMSDAAAAPAKPAAKAAPKKKAAAKPKAPAAHPKYSEMIKQAVSALKERGGSSRQAILKYIMKNFKVGNDDGKVNTHLKMALRAGVKNNSLKQAKGSGASGSFRLGEAAKKAAKPKKAKKPKAAKPKKPKTPKKKAAKKAKTPKKAAKKPKKAKTPKKAAKPAKKAAKKPAAKKAAKPAKKYTRLTSPSSQSLTLKL